MHDSTENAKSPTRRSIMREVIFKVLFSFDTNLKEDAKRISMMITELFSEEGIYNKPLVHEAEKYIFDEVEKQGEIDEIIKRYLFNWDWKRLSAVDRNILRLGVYELVYKMNIPIEVTLNEAVEMAKKYGTDKSSKFVNGILDAVSKEMVPKEKQLL
ncbi:MAG: transcription antitermination factor NusB [Thermotogota bacterium]